MGFQPQGHRGSTEFPVTTHAGPSRLTHAHNAHRALRECELSAVVEESIEASKRAIQPASPLGRKEGRKEDKQAGKLAASSSRSRTKKQTDTMCVCVRVR